MICMCMCVCMAQIVPTSPHPPSPSSCAAPRDLNWVRCETEASGDTGGSGGGGQGYWTVVVVDAAAAAVDTAAASVDTAAGAVDTAAATGILIGDRARVAAEWQGTFDTASASAASLEVSPLAACSPSLKHC